MNSYHKFVDMKFIVTQCFTKGVTAFAIRLDLIDISKPLNNLDAISEYSVDNDGTNSVAEAKVDVRAANENEPVAEA